MREFAKREIINEKCHICGSRNKIFAYIADDIDNKLLGYTLKCCACGRKNDLYFGSKGRADMLLPPTKHTHTLEPECIQISFCPMKECPLYGTCKHCYGDDTKPVKKEKDELPYIQNKMTVEVCNPPRFL